MIINNINNLIEEATIKKLDNSKEAIQRRRKEKYASIGAKILTGNFGKAVKARRHRIGRAIGRVVGKTTYYGVRTGELAYKKGKTLINNRRKK
jgi:hypothetical protein